MLKIWSALPVRDKYQHGLMEPPSLFHGVISVGFYVNLNEMDCYVCGSLIILLLEIISAAGLPEFVSLIPTEAQGDQ